MIGNTLIPNDNPGALSQNWARLKSILSNLFARVLNSIGDLAWRTIVAGQRIPAYVDVLIGALKRIPTATSTALIKLTRIVAKNLTNFWDYFTGLFGGKLDDAQTQAKEETLQFGWVLQSAATTFRDVTYELSTCLAGVVSMLAETLYSAMTTLTGAFFSVIESAVSKVDTVKNSMMEYGFFYMMVMGDPSAIAGQRQVFVEARISAITRHFALFAETIAPDLVREKESLDASESSIYDLFPIAAAFKVGEDIVSWILSKVAWLVDALRKITSAAVHWLRSSIFMAPMIATVVGPEVAKMAESVKDMWGEPSIIQKQQELLKNLARNNSMSAADRRTLNKVLEASDEVLKYFTDQQTQFKNARWGKKDADILKEKTQAAKLIMQLINSPEGEDVPDSVLEGVSELQTNALGGITPEAAEALAVALEQMQSVQLMHTLSAIQNDDFERVTGNEDLTQEEKDLDERKKRVLQKKALENRKREVEELERIQKLTEDARVYSAMDIDKLERETRKVRDEYENSLKALAEFDSQNSVARNPALMQAMVAAEREFERRLDEGRIKLDGAEAVEKASSSMEQQLSLLNDQLIRSVAAASDMEIVQSRLHDMRRMQEQSVLSNKARLVLIEEVLVNVRRNRPVYLPLVGRTRFTMDTVKWKTWGAFLICVTAGGIMAHGLYASFFPKPGVPFHVARPDGFDSFQTKTYTPPADYGNTVLPESGWGIGALFGTFTHYALPLSPAAIFNGQLITEFAGALSLGVASIYQAGRIVALFTKLSGFLRGSVAIVAFWLYFVFAVYFAIIDLISGRHLSTVLEQYGGRIWTRGRASLVYFVNAVAQSFQEHQAQTNGSLQTISSVGSDLFGFLSNGPVGTVKAIWGRVSKWNTNAIPLIPSLGNWTPEWKDLLPIEDKNEVSVNYQETITRALERTDPMLRRTQLEEAAKNTTALVGAIKDRIQKDPIDRVVSRRRRLEPLVLPDLGPAAPPPSQRASNVELLSDEEESAL